MPKMMIFSQKADKIKACFDADSYMNCSKVCVDTVKNALENYSKEQANDLILKKVYEIMELSDKPTEYEVRRALNNTAKREALFEIISDTVEDTLVSGWQASPFFMQYVETKTMALGQKNEFYTPDTTELVISKVSASNHDMIRQRLGAGSTFSVTTAYYGAKVYMESERYLMQAEDWSALVAKISVAYTKAINTLLNTAVMGAGASLPSPTQWNVTGELTSANYDELIKLISDVATATGTEPVLMGTKVALSGLKNVGNVTYLSDQAKQDIYTTGLISSFEGTPLVVIPQAFEKNDTSKYLVDNTKILVMPTNIDKFVKFYYEGATTVKEVTDSNTNTDATIEYELGMKFGAGVLTSTRFGTWTISK